MKNAAWLMGGKLLQMVVDLVAGLLTARYLGPDNFGLIHYAAAYTGFAAVFCSLGLPSILIKELTGEPEKEGEILGTAWFLRGLSSLAASCLVLAAACRAEGEKRIFLVTVLFSCLGMGLQMLEGFSDWLQYRRLSSITAAAYLLAHLLAALCKLLLLMTGKPVQWFALTAAVEQLTSGTCLLLAYRKYGGKRLRISRERGKVLLAKSRHFLLPGIMAAVYGQTDKLMLGALLGEAETGYYATAVSLSGAWCFVLSAMIQAAYPAIAQAHQRSRALFEKQNRQLYGLVFYLSLGVSLGFCLVGEPLVLALYGEAYLPAAAPLRVITWYTGFSYLGVARNIWIVCENRQNRLIWVYAGAAASNVLLNLAWIPRWGTVGAAGASLAAQIFTAVLGPLFIPGLRENGRLIWGGILLQDLWDRKKVEP